MAEAKAPAKPTTAPTKKKPSWFQKIPTDILLSPGGIILAFLALIIEVMDLIPIPVIDQIWELPLEILLIILLFSLVPDLSWKSMIIPFVIERIPILNDILPTWFLRIIG